MFGISVAVTALVISALFRWRKKNKAQKKKTVMAARLLIQVGRTNMQFDN